MMGTKNINGIEKLWTSKSPFHWKGTGLVFLAFFNNGAFLVVLCI